MPMVKPEETIYLWDNEELMNHSATKHLEKLSRVTSLNEEAAKLRAKLAAASAAGSDVGSTEGYVCDGEEAPSPQPLTKRRADMSLEDYKAAEVAAAANIRRRLREIEEEQKELPPEEDVNEAIEGELPPADPEIRPRSPSPSRKWKPPLPPLPPEEEPAEENAEMKPDKEDLDNKGSREVDHGANQGGWEQDESRPETASGIQQAAAAIEPTGDFYPDSSGRQSPSFYNEHGELMVSL